MLLFKDKFLIDIYNTTHILSSFVCVLQLRRSKLQYPFCGLLILGYYVTKIMTLMQLLRRYLYEIKIKYIKHQEISNV